MLADSSKVCEKPFITKRIAKRLNKFFIVFVFLC
jgi:hypothetical protein